MSSISGISGNNPMIQRAVAAQKPVAAAKPAPMVRDSDGDFDGSRPGEVEPNKGRNIDTHA